MKKYIAVISLGILLLACLTAGVQASTDTNKVITVYLFWGDGCPHCAQEKVLLRELASKYGDALEIKEYEIWYHPENKQFLLDMAKAHNIKVEGVPVTFVGKRAWTGFNEVIGREISKAIENEMAGVTTSTTPPQTSVRVPFKGEIDLQGQSLFWATVLIGFVDGINPCSLWVLSLLLAMMLRSGSRQKILLVGIVFLAVAAIIYSLFLAGLFSVFSYVGYLRWIQVLVALMALFIGAINVKEYFAFRQGPSLTISDQYKPRIYQGIRTVMEQKGPITVVGTTATLAAGVSLMELPCTAGFPIVWSNLVTAQGVGRLEFSGLLMLYMLMYLLDELIIFFTAVITLKASRLQEQQGRALKLGGGSLMLALAGTLLMKPELMNELSGTLFVFAVAIIAAGAVALIHHHRQKRRQIQS